MEISGAIDKFVIQYNYFIMKAISITKLYDLLISKVGREPAEYIANFVEDKLNDEFETKSKMMATKDDLTKFATKDDLSATKEDLMKEISRLDIKISDTKAEIIRWMFVFWVAQVVSTFGLILLFVKK